MTNALRQTAAQHLVKLAESRLRECEDAFTEHLADDALPYLAEIAKAEQHVVEARACLAAADAIQRTQAKQAAASTKHL